jgi:hypothetical protein
LEYERTSYHNLLAAQALSAALQKHEAVPESKSIYKHGLTGAISPRVLDIVLFVVTTDYEPFFQSKAIILLLVYMDHRDHQS